MLIILRGNSGSGKSITAKHVREAVIKLDKKRKIAIVEQDYIRRFILKQKETEGTDNIELIEQTVMFALSRDYSVILEGILYSERYKPMLERLMNVSEKTYVYYFDIPFEETLVRHESKSNAHEFGEKEMLRWYREKDLLGVDNERIITDNLSQQQIIDKIIADTAL